MATSSIFPIFRIESFVAAGASPSALESSLSMCLIRSMTQQEQPHTLSSLHTTVAKVVPSVMPALGTLSGVSSPRRSLPGGHIFNLDSEVNHRDIGGRSARSVDVLC